MKKRKSIAPAYSTLRGKGSALKGKYHNRRPLFTYVCTMLSCRMRRRLYSGPAKQMSCCCCYIHFRKKNRSLTWTEDLLCCACTTMARSNPFSFVYYLVWVGWHVRLFACSALSQNMTARNESVCLLKESAPPFFFSSSLFLALWHA